MKKTLIVTIGVILILIVLGVWVYLLFFGTPENTGDVFSDLGLGDNAFIEDTVTDPVVDIPIEEDQGTELAIGGALQQLTTRPVAGFGYVGTSSDILRYVERGTGYVFEIDMVNDTENRITGTTIPRVVHAVFSPDGDAVAVVTEENLVTRVLAGAIDTENESVDFISLQSNAFDPVFIGRTMLQYGVKTNDGTSIYELDILSEDPVRIGSVPFTDVRVLADGAPHVFNRPTQYFKGTLYRVSGGLEAVTPGEFGFVGGLNERYYFGSAVSNDVYETYAIDRTTDDTIGLPITFIPEKCSTVPGITTSLWCAAPFEEYAENTLEMWYQGGTHFEDELWQINIPLQEATLVSSMQEESGRQVDVDMMRSDNQGQKPLFRNKIDDTLWVYDTTI